MKKSIDKDIDKLIKEMTLDEKIAMIHGSGLFRTEAVERLGIPALMTSDGPMGVRNEFQNNKWIPSGTTDDYVSYMPSNSALASTWNRAIAYEAGDVLGDEARGRGKDVILAPGVNIKRSPLCGRNFEYMSEDPYLTAQLTAPMIQGIQQNDVAACVKHFAVNSQETSRLEVNEVVDERTLREIYYPAFKAAVQEGGTYSVMGAYNKLNGEYCCENKVLLQQVLRDEWGFDGTVISDWGAVHNTLEAAQAPMDIEMSIFDNFDEYLLANPLKEAILAGEIEETYVDKKVHNILKMMYRLRMIGAEKDKRKDGAYNTFAHQMSLLKAAEESVVLLKNNVLKLPLNKEHLRGKRIGVIGKNASMIHSNGGGSAEIKALYEISPLMGIKTFLGGNVEVVYVDGYEIPEKPEPERINWQAASVSLDEGRALWNAAKKKSRQKFKEQLNAPITETGLALQKEAIELAKTCDELIFVGGINHDFDCEGDDRFDMKLPYHQDELIEELLKINPNMIVVMIGGSPVEMPWAGKVGSLIWSYYAGMETGHALANVIFGAVNPSGKLAETFPVCYEDSPTGQNGQFGQDDKVVHSEGIFLGYRHYESKGIDPLFCFGHGLSYTTFEYSNMRVKVKETKNNVAVSVKCDIRNVGKMAGAEVCQLYVRDRESSKYRPIKELKQFEKLYLKPNEKKTVTFDLDREAFAFYHEDRRCFIVEPGAFDIYIGSSSKDIKQQEEVAFLRDIAY